MASFDKAVPPGGEGRITLKVNTKGFEGNINKSAKVYTNDPRMTIFTLGIRAFVQVPIFVRPRYLNLNGKEGGSLTRSVVITAGLEEPLMIEPDRFSLDGKMTYKIEEIEKGRKFKVSFTSVPGVSGNFRGFLNLKTNYQEKPIVNISIRGRFAKKRQVKSNSD